MTGPAYCTILARNYLGRALALKESLLRHAGPMPLTICVIDATADTQLPEIAGVSWMTPASLGLGERRLLELAMSYDLVEFATALKPLVLQVLLREHEQVVYLDPDTHVVSPMLELGQALAGGATIVLTPHFLKPVPAGAQFPEGHLLHVGVYNLGFCAVSRGAQAFLDWWWGHLRSECLVDPIAGLFVDQKWVDIGSVLFDAAVLRHPGYNVSVANLDERPIGWDAGGYHIAGTDDRLRLFHFHAFDPRQPEQLYSRQRIGGGDTAVRNETLATLSRQYASVLLEQEHALGAQPAYRYATDTTGRPITRHLRHAYRVEALADPNALPSPFVPSEAAAYARWRRRARTGVARHVLSDLAKGARSALPEEYGALKRRLPGLTKTLHNRYIENSGMWK